MIRIATSNDLPALVSIYNEAIAARFATADTAPVSVESRRAWFDDHEPDFHPLFVYEEASEVVGWCSLSAYRKGRMALRFTAEISYYVRTDARRKGVASRLVRHALEVCPSLPIKNVFAIVLERNISSLALLEKFGFERWGFLPRVADFDGEECGHYYYGRRVLGSNESTGTDVALLTRRAADAKRDCHGA
jgi:L-amino acid N-acyltransferase YncA